MQSNKIDYHIHTTCSDGQMDPVDVVRQAKELGYDAIAITDHDNMNGIREALTAGKAVRISGSALKIGGTGSGIFLVPVAEGAEDLPPDSDESTWVPVGRLVSNKPKTLEFWLPDGAAPGLWRIALRTLFLKGNMERKTAVTSFSKVLRITAG